MSTKPHFLARKFQDFQRSAASQGYLCSFCDDGFQQEPKLWEHAKSLHRHELNINDSGDEQEVRKKFAKSANERIRKTPRRVNRGSEPIKTQPSSNDNDSMRPNFGGEALTPTSPGPPFSALHSGKQISDIENLTLSQNQPAETLSEAQAGLLSPFNPLKRGAAETTGIPDLSPDQSIGNKISGSRRTKALSGEAFTSKDPDFDREGSHANEPEFQRGRVGSIKRLFDPHTDNPSPTHTNRRSKLQEPADGPRRTHDRKSHVFRSRKSPSADKDDFERKIIFNKGVEDPPNLERLLNQPSKLDRALSARQDEPDMVGANLDNDWEPEILLQPETRPISHEQLLVEVKGIYAGLVMVEAKCIEVDEEQSQRAREKDPSRQTRLSNEQWQALIALHKTLLHEHHDFFLASQHPSASPALSRLAAKYTMPARMWRHGIHAFLEVLRHRLPGSLDHMLAFIYIAYSMVALLYETVSTFEDTWIECLGDLGRYRMAIEDDDIRDREVWSGVARFWYSKAADKTPDVGRLYHHLAILARPYTLQQLSLYTRSLTCENPFESARGSIMTLFTPILNGKESAHHRSSSFETILIKAHGILFSGKSQSVFSSTVDQLIGGGILDNYIGRVTAKFREQGVFVAVANIAALFEYGGSVKQSSSPVSILRPAFKGLRDAEARARSKAESEAGAELDVKVKAEGKVLSSEKPKEEVEKLLESAFDINEITLRSSSFSCQSALESLTPSDLDSSISMINHASKLAFGTLSTCLQRIGDKNVLPIISVYFIFIFDLTRVEDVPPHLEKRLPWAEMCSFLNYLAKPENLTARVRSKHFPIPNYLGNRPLPEDFVMRGQWFFPQDRFSKATVDDEERSIELSDMVASRVERILWLGLRMASSESNKWIFFDKTSRKFSTEKCNSSGNQKTKYSDNVMSDVANNDDMAGQEASRFSISPKHPANHSGGDSLAQDSGEIPSPADVLMTDVGTDKSQIAAHMIKKLESLDSPSIMKAGFDKKSSSKKANEKTYLSDPHKLDKIHTFDLDQANEPSKALSYLFELLPHSEVFDLRQIVKENSDKQ